MKLMYEAGVDAVLSLDTTTSAGVMGVMPLPTSADSAAVAAEAGMLYHTVAAADYTTTAGVDEIAAFMDFALANTGQASSGNGPIFVYDSRGVNAVAAVQLFRARRNLITADAGSTKTAKAIEEAENHGFTLTATVVQAIARETGETYDATTMAGSMNTVAQATATEGIMGYHWLKYLYNIGNVGISTRARSRSSTFRLSLTRISRSSSTCAWARRRTGAGLPSRRSRSTSSTSASAERQRASAATARWGSALPPTPPTPPMSPFAATW
jgi:hypothetical protein